MKKYIESSEAFIHYDFVPVDSKGLKGGEMVEHKTNITGISFMRETHENGVKKFIKTYISIDNFKEIISELKRLEELKETLMYENNLPW